MCPGSWGRGTKASLADLPNASHTKRFCMATRQPLPQTHKHTCTRPRPSQNCIYDGACQKSVAVPAVTVVVTPWPSPRARHTGQQQQSPPASPPAVRGPSPQNGFHCSHSTRISIHEGPSLARPNARPFPAQHHSGARHGREIRGITFSGERWRGSLLSTILERGRHFETEPLLQLDRYSWHTRQCT